VNGWQCPAGKTKAIGLVELAIQTVEMARGPTGCGTDINIHEVFCCGDEPCGNIRKLPGLE